MNAALLGSMIDGSEIMAIKKLAVSMASEVILFETVFFLFLRGAAQKHGFFYPELPLFFHLSS